jgi:shikimate dehydrogenase
MPDNADIIVNATPLGMRRGDLSPVPLKYLNKKTAVYDIVYNRNTRLIEYSKKLKIKHANGMGMLLNQGALAFHLWTKKTSPKKIMLKALLKELKKNT